MTRVEFCCDPDDATVPLPHNWEHTIGSDHAAMALRTEYQEQLKRCHDELGIGHVRCHGLLSHDMGTLVTHGRNQSVSFHNAHSIWDFLLDNGMKPFVEVSFMPDAIASGQTTVFHSRGNVTPPKRYSDCRCPRVERGAAGYSRGRSGNGPERVEWTKFWTSRRGATFRSMSSVRITIPLMRR